MPSVGAAVHERRDLAMPQGTRVVGVEHTQPLLPRMFVNCIQLGTRRHIDAGAGHVVLAAPAKDDDGEDTRTVLMGRKPAGPRTVAGIVERVLHDEFRGTGH